MKQRCILEPNAIRHLKSELTQLGGNRIFLVAGEHTYRMSGIRKYLADAFGNGRITRFKDFSPNPRYEDIQNGIRCFKSGSHNVIVAAGGGSAMDTAKLINIFSHQPEDPIEYIKNHHKITAAGKPLIAIPTTSGSGSEATHFAVIYLDGIKYSVAHKSMLPSVAIVDPQLTASLPGHIAASSGMDALSQAIESFWSIHSTPKSKSYSRVSISLIMDHLEDRVNRPDGSNRLHMAQASYLAGKAINITKTTAPHAFSYPLTTRFNLAHGHAVAMTLGEVLLYNSGATGTDISDPRGLDFLNRSMQELYGLLRCSDAVDTSIRIKKIMENIGLETRLSPIGVSKESITTLLEEVNPDRLSNNPRAFTPEAVQKLFEKIL